jgi:23S rRNA (cytidine1920-2'-O)/16S rRNA (cytidine1409-2'-O)-methyltransferase
MVKPQFEVGRDRSVRAVSCGTRGLRAEAVLDVAAAAHSLDLGVAGIAVSPLPGPSGNVEFFLWLRRGAPPVDPEAVRETTAESEVARSSAADGEALSGPASAVPVQP